MGTQTRAGRLRNVFRCDQNDVFDAQVARLCVLYEDLRIEMMGMAARSLPVLDVLDSENDHPDRPEMVGSFRQVYFMRRSIATTLEFASALRLLNESPSFPLVSKAFNGYAKETWGNAIAFFDKDHESVIRRIRNDIGGHFGQKAARSALERLRPESTGKMEIVTKGGSSDIRLAFAGELAVSALVSHLPDQDVDKFKNLLNDTLVESFRHATRAVQVLCGVWVWQRFGR